MKQSIEDLHQVLLVLSCQKRFTMLQLLGKNDHYVKELSEMIELKPTKVSEHLAMLKSLNLLSSYKVGSRTYYHIKEKKIMELISCIQECYLN